MKFIVDAQLPRSLSMLINTLGENAVHTLDLPDQNKTGDHTINKIAVEEDRIVITKDNDFLQTHLLTKIPPKLLLVNTGNIKNSYLLNLFSKNFDLLVKLFGSKNLIELTKQEVIVHS